MCVQNLSNVGGFMRRMHSLQILTENSPYLVALTVYVVVRKKTYIVFIRNLFF